MGDMWRSQKMQLVQMIVQNDAAHAVVNKLGKVGLLQFRDLNAGTSFYKRSFVEEVRKCDELSRLLRLINDEMVTSSIPLADKDETKALALGLDDVEEKIHHINEELTELKQQQELLTKNDNALREQKLVLELGKEIYVKKGGGLLDEPMSKERTQMAELMALSEFANTTSSLLGQVSGVIKTEHVGALERTLFRATRGNAVFHSHDVETPLLDVDGKNMESVTKTFFMVLFAGEVMRDKISKVCSYFGASLYKFPDSSDELATMNLRVDERLAESDAVLKQGEHVIIELLTTVATTFATWRFTVEKEKMIFDTLNMCEFDIKRHVFLAEGWVPCNKYDVVVKSLEAATLECGLDTRPILNKMETKVLTPPTHIPVTNFTSGFQALVNTYGTPRYREVNPGAFCCIFFPFLFGIMFGDFGHGSMLAAFGYFLISKEKEWGDGSGLNDMVQMCYGGRYIILLNGLFGAYVGILYNEAFPSP
jgi:V-type H+-transporting ATPase subunit a